MWSDLLEGYAISNGGHGNFKLPLLFVVMLLPLIFGGAGKLSLDHLAARIAGATQPIVAEPDLYAAALAAAVIGIPFLMLIPAFGGALLAVAAVLALCARLLRG